MTLDQKVDKIIDSKFIFTAYGFNIFWHQLPSTVNNDTKMNVFHVAVLYKRLSYCHCDVTTGYEPTATPAPTAPAWQGRSIGTSKLRLVEFSAFLEQQRDPDSVSVILKHEISLMLFIPASYHLALRSVN